MYSKTNILLLTIFILLALLPLADWSDPVKRPLSIASTSLKIRTVQDGDKPNKKPTKYAVLINASKEDRFENDLAVGYEVLLKNGFSRKNIYVLDYDDTDTFLHPTDGSAIEVNLKVVFDHLKTKITNKDLLLVYVSDHGDRIQKRMKGIAGTYVTGLSVIVLADNSPLDPKQIDQKRFSQYFDGVNPKVGIFIFGQCYSGGFAEEMGKKNFVAVAATQATIQSWPTTNDSFIGYFMLAFRDTDESDSNRDGKVSMTEALEYAKRRNTSSKNGSQKPFIQADLDPNNVFLK